MMYTMPKNLLSICVNFALATQPFFAILVICKSKFLLGMEFNLTNASVIYLWNLVLQIAFTSGIVSKIPYKQTRCNR